MIRKTADNNSLQKVNRQTFRVVIYLNYLEDPAKDTICVYLAGSSVINHDSVCGRREAEINAEFWEPACGKSDNE